MTAPIDLKEGSRPFTIALSRSLAAALSGLGIATLIPAAGPSEYVISNIQKVGAVIVDGAVVRIQPKTPVRRLFALLEYALSPDAIWSEEEIAFDLDEDIYSVVAYSFARSAQKALARGLLRGYVVKDEALPIVRGRWRITDQLTRRAGNPLPLEVTFDDYTEEIIENQVIKSAVLRTLRFPGLTSSTVLSLRRSLRILDGVTALARGQRSPAISVSRANMRYQGALQLAALILSDASLEHREGEIVGSGFLMDLWRVFEDFVGAALGGALSSHTGTSTTQYRSMLDEDQSVVIRPDLVWLDGDGVRACIDIKYKVEKHGSYPNADLYQLIAYCTRFGLDVGHLVYAAGDAQAGRVVVTNGPTIYQHALDLDVPFPDLLDQVSALAARIKENASSQLAGSNP